MFNTPLMFPFSQSEGSVHGKGTLYYKAPVVEFRENQYTEYIVHNVLTSLMITLASLRMSMETPATSFTSSLTLSMAHLRTARRKF